MFAMNFVTIWRSNTNVCYMLEAKTKASYYLLIISTLYFMLWF